MRCMHHHAKPNAQDFDPDHIKLYCGTNGLNYDRTSSQIAREIIDLALSLKSNKNKISISLITLKNRLINMCSR